MAKEMMLCRGPEPELRPAILVEPCTLTGNPVRGQCSSGSPGGVRQANPCEMAAFTYHVAMPVDPTSLAIRLHPDTVLREKAQPVESIDDEVRAVAARMLELMDEAEGIGLAAPQVGLPWRLFVTRDLTGHSPGVVWINPVLECIDSSTEIDEEGCLSLPGILVKVNRPIGIRIRGLNELGEEVVQETDEHLARVWQHEHDHLDGVLIIDRMSSMDRIRNRRAIRDLERG